MFMPKWGKDRKKPDGQQGMALFTPDGWAEVRAASEMGLSDATICQDFGIKPSTLRKKRSDARKKGDPWLTPAEAKRQSAIAKVNNQFKTISNSTKEAPITAADAVVNNLLKDGELASSHAMKILLRKLTAAAFDPGQVRDIETVAEVVTAVKGARGISGLDKPETALQINLSSCFPS